MKLSMEILSDRLLSYLLDSNITAGGMKISGTRLLATAAELRSDILYITSARDYFNDDLLDDCVLCVHGSDWLRLRLTDENAAFAIILDIIEEFNAWETRLRDAAQSGQDMQYFIDVSGSVIAFPVFITDAMGNVVGYSKEYGEGEVDAFWDAIVLREKIHDRMFTGSLTDDRSRDVYDLDATPKIYNTHRRRIIGMHLMQSEEPVGTITIIEFGGNFTQGILQLAGVFYDAASSAVQKRGEDAQLRTAAAIARDYLDGNDADEQSLWKHIRGYAGSSSDALELILFRNTQRADFMYKSNMSLRLSGAGAPCFCVPYHDYIMVVIACDDEFAFLAKARELLSGDEYLCGISLMFSSAETMRGAVSQALLAMKIGNQTPCAVNKCVDYAYAYLISRLADDDTVAAGLLHPSLTVLKRYDAKYRTSLYHTLYEYLRLERNVVAAAKQLFIHRNTMIYRLQRLDALLGLDLDDIYVRMYILLSYHIDMVKDD